MNRDYDHIREYIEADVDEDTSENGILDEDAKKEKKKKIIIIILGVVFVLIFENEPYLVDV